MTWLWNLWNLFGFIGIASILFGLAAVAAVAFAAVKRYRPPLLWTALAAVLVAGLFAEWNSQRIWYDWDFDRTEQEQAQQAAALAEAEKQLDQHVDLTADIAFAEDTRAERLDLAGFDDGVEDQGAPADTPADPDSAAGEPNVILQEVLTEEELAAQREAAAAEADPAPETYRDRGPVERDPGKSRGLEFTEEELADLRPDEVDEEGGVVEGATETVAGPSRLLPEPELRLARSMDRVNRSSIDLIFWAVILLLLLDYLLRFNRQDRPLTPAPVAGAWMRLVSRAPGLFRIDHADRDAIARWLQQTVHRRETFLAITAEDPLPGRDRLERIRIGLWRFWTLPLRRITAGELTDPERVEAMGDALWFRHAALLADERDAEAVLDAVIEYLHWRRRTRAAVGVTIHLVWAGRGKIDPVRWRELAFLAEECGWTLVDAGAEPSLTPEQSARHLAAADAAPPTLAAEIEPHLETATDWFNRRVVEPWVWPAGRRVVAALGAVRDELHGLAIQLAAGDRTLLAAGGHVARQSVSSAWRGVGGVRGGKARRRSGPAGKAARRQPDTPMRDRLGELAETQAPSLPETPRTRTAAPEQAGQPPMAGTAVEPPPSPAPEPAAPAPPDDDADELAAALAGAADTPPVWDDQPEPEPEPASAPAPPPPAPEPPVARPRRPRARPASSSPAKGDPADIPTARPKRAPGGDAPAEPPKAQPARVRVACEHCGKKLAVKAQLLGKTIKCPACEKPTTLPAPPTAAPRRPRREPPG